ncbi:MAG: hypothetical protein ABIU09_10160 [Pyrinomonadaceae bacterium]
MKKEPDFRRMETMNKRFLGGAIPSILVEYSLLLAVFSSFYLSIATAQVRPPPRAGQLKDIIISSEGVREGKLAGCVGSVCSMDNVSTFGIVGIGLKADVRSRPSPSNPVQDEVRYHDGSVHPGRLVGINSDLVVTERGRHQRALVAWVYLAPRRETAAPGGQIGAPTPTSLPSPTVTPTPNPTPTLGPTPVPSLPPGVQRGALWTGRVESTRVYAEGSDSERVTTVYDPVRLREYLQPMLGPRRGVYVRAGTMAYFVSEGTVVTETTQRYHGSCLFAGRGQSTLTGRLFTGGSGMYKKSVDIDTTRATGGWNVPLGPGVYGLHFSPGVDDDYPLSICPSQQRYHEDELKVIFQYVDIGRFPFTGSPLDPQMRFLEAGDGRMSGSYTAARNGAQITVSWSICREGVRCPPPPSAARESVSLGKLFETDLAILRDSEADPTLAGVVSKMKADPSLRPEIRVILMGGGDPIFLEVMAAARIRELKAWFAERGVDASRIDWTWETTGASDEVVITY